MGPKEFYGYTPCSVFRRHDDHPTHHVYFASPTHPTPAKPTANTSSRPKRVEENVSPPNRKIEGGGCVQAAGLIETYLKNARNYSHAQGCLDPLLSAWLGLVQDLLMPVYRLDIALPWG